ncbi:hypothetical protein PITCH_A150003 [uncultured Desulfobacterium sp.]|uniref:Uncharacterized protein n=1 Tax=uncultured Desulfobacterium sp. TaxID=201089 RepID=A0A445MT20_9BACT|nr:hypothetical protein PITCH_A150003 [uncultured Desulfobacterium sp.]
MDNILKNLISRFLGENATWLANAFKMTERVSSSRGNRYGFEWPVQTAFGCFLLELQENGEVSSVGIGKQETNRKKYDISFTADGKNVIVEIKTPAGGAISYVKSDVQKEFPDGSLPFFLIFSDPRAPSKAPPLAGTKTIETWVTHEDFRCYLYRKNSEQQPRPLKLNVNRHRRRDGGNIMRSDQVDFKKFFNQILDLLNHKTNIFKSTKRKSTEKTRYWGASAGKLHLAWNCYHDRVALHFYASKKTDKKKILVNKQRFQALQARREEIEKTFGGTLKMGL